jgi:hypothetical protein
MKSITLAMVSKWPESISKSKAAVKPRRRISDRKRTLKVQDIIQNLGSPQNENENLGETKPAYRLHHFQPLLQRIDFRALGVILPERVSRLKELESED